MQAEILVGMRVSLFVPNAKNEKEKRKLALSSVIEELHDEDFILIQMPTYRGYYYMLPNEPFLMRFLFKEKPYSLLVTFDGRIEREGFVLARLRRYGPIERHQIRDSFRLACYLPVIVGCSAEKLSSGGDPESVATNLSENGMLLSTNKEFEPNEEIIISFDIGGFETVDCLVIRSEEASHGIYRYKVGLMFRHRDKKQSDRIYRYIMNVQRTQMKKERG